MMGDEVHGKMAHPEHPLLNSLPFSHDLPSCLYCPSLRIFLAVLPDVY
jgi:hypothetical protein